LIKPIYGKLKEGMQNVY